MNPFERLRKAIDKVDINYVIPEQKNEDFQENQEEYRATTTTVYGNDLQSMWTQKQTQYIQQINRLSSKAERLEKANKKMELQNEEFVKEVCQLQKNNELLTAKLEQIGKGAGHWDDKERKYKEEIHRVNLTVSQLGQQLNQERSAKKALNLELIKIKQALENKQKEWMKENEVLMSKISELKEEIAERTAMLEYNIKKSADERRQAKALAESTRRDLQKQVQSLRYENSSNRQKICNLNGQINLQRQKKQTIEEKLQELLTENQSIKIKYKQLEKQNQDFRLAVDKLTEQERCLSEQKEGLIELLQKQKQNVKVKVVQLRDETMQLQLEMYKKQCKDLLQEKALLGTFTRQRFSNQYLIEKQ